MTPDHLATRDRQKVARRHPHTRDCPVLDQTGLPCTCGATDRRQRALEGNPLRYVAGVVIEEDRILLLQRPYTAKGALGWGCPLRASGALEWDEEALVAAFFEIGVRDIKVGQLLPFVPETPYLPLPRVSVHLDLVFYAIEVDPGEVRSEVALGQSAGVGWFTRHELRALGIPPEFGVWREPLAFYIYDRMMSRR